MMDRSLGKAKGAANMLGWRMNQALVKTFCLMVLSLVVVLAWESRRPFNRVLDAPEPGIIQLHLGEAEETQTLRDSAGQFATSDVESDGGPARKVAILEAAVVDEDGPEDVPSQGDDGGSDADTSAPAAAETTAKEHSDLDSREKRISSDIFPRRLAADVREEDESRDFAEESLITKFALTSDETGTNISSGSEVCDFSRGSWVKDENRGFYSGLECKSYLARSWACRELNRPEFEYEKFRWQPEDCDLPSFTGARFLQRMRNQVLAFVGDSLGRQQFQSLMCMITSGKDDMEVEDVTKVWGADVGWAYHFPATNTTVLFSWSSSLCEIESGHPNEKDGWAAMHLDRPAAFLRDNLGKLDVVILNTGHHWNRGKLQSNKGHPYVNGKPVADRKLAGMGEAMNFTVFKVVQGLDVQLAELGTRQPAVYLRTLSPRHFKNGEWDSGGSCDATRPQLESSKLAKVVHSPYRGPIMELVAKNAVKGTRVRLLDVTYLSQSREEGHISRFGRGKDSSHQDCLHWCLPGVPDVWNEVFFGYLATQPN